MDLKSIPKGIVGEGRILVVDDEPDVRELLVDMLEMEGYEVRSAEDGQAAQKVLEQSPFDLVLTDLQMPNIGGMELIEAVRRVDPNLPVIVITAYPSLRKAIEVMKCGAVDFLPKPFELDTVLHVVRRTLKERVLTLENRRLLAEVNNKAVIERLNRELHRKVEELTKLNVISERLSGLLDTDQLFDEVVKLAADLTGAERVSLMLYDRRLEILRIRAAVGLSSRLIRETIVRVGEGIAGKVAASKTVMRVTRDAPPGPEEPGANGNRYESGSWISVPLLIGGELLGVLNVTERLGLTNFGAAEENVLTTLAEKAAAKVENNALYESLYDNLLDTLHSLVTTIEAKDPYTHRHSQRVTDLAVALAQRMGLAREEIESLRFATMLHDIGKIGIRDNILIKKGQLSIPEYEQIKTHPLVGDRIVAPLGLTAAERDIIRHHHERLDGKGYPDGLGADEISILARIVTVADAFDAMTSTRPYRKALSVAAALSELYRCSGAQFDKDIVELLCDGIQVSEIKVSLPEERTALEPAELVG